MNSFYAKGNDLMRAIVTIFGILAFSCTVFAHTKLDVFVDRDYGLSAYDSSTGITWYSKVYSGYDVTIRDVISTCQDLGLSVPTKADFESAIANGVVDLFDVPRKWRNSRMLWTQTFDESGTQTFVLKVSKRSLKISYNTIATFDSGIYKKGDLIHTVGADIVCIKK